MENRKKILECAIDLFYQRGYDAVGVQEIAVKSGVTKPTLYYYFKSKRGLLDAIIEEKYTVLNQKLEEASACGTGIKENLYQLIKVYLRFAAEEKKAYFLLVALVYSARNNEVYRAIRPTMVAQHQIIVGVFEKRKEELGNMNGRQEQFAIGFAGMVHYYILYLMSGEKEKISEEEVIQSILHQFMHGIYS